ncbi:hypothetical protein MLD38_001471 [Melastoma candidum]|uniref:Uncharacterized protein n=1 Tax=Melastoma candidum TaxID=119954 RepID=A0ACB9SI95_9MYRT|nr:hypothetical protein MLD38_001471 [Melastoma candidum]
MKHKQKQQRSKQQAELFWPRLLVRKWLNINARESDYSADTDTDTEDDPDDNEATEGCWRGSHLGICDANGAPLHPTDVLPRIRRRNSETFRAQYINTKELKIRVGTWNVGGKLPPDDLDIDDWIDICDPADIYVLGFQEIVPLNAGNIFGAEDNRPVPKWENIVRKTLNRARPSKPKVKCYSDPPSPSRFKPSDDVPDIEEEIMLESDSDGDEEVHPVDDDVGGLIEERIPESEEVIMSSEGCGPIDGNTLHQPEERDLQRKYSSQKRLDRLNCLKNEETEESLDIPAASLNRKLTRTLTGSERIGLSWPEPPLNLISQKKLLRRPQSFKSVRSFQASRSFGKYNSIKSRLNEGPPDLAFLTDLDLEMFMARKARAPYVRIVSKQMVGIFLTIWVHRSLRRHIQNLKVSTVGVGVMGYIGNKGSISVSMSIYQTFFCFICAHLASGEKDGDELKRNADVHEIHRRTIFHPVSSLGLPKGIIDHEQIIWLGDLNYRINLTYDKARELISKKEWSKLMEKDQLVRELRKGRTFDGWNEGPLLFPPTYKYELNSEKYFGEDPKVGRRTPAWCDRILYFGKGMKQLCYQRAEIMLSDHRPVKAAYMSEVEVFSARKLQRALTFTDAEIENEEVMTNRVVYSALVDEIGSRQCKSYVQVGPRQDRRQSSSWSYSPETIAVALETPLACCDEGVAAFPRLHLGFTGLVPFIMPINNSSRGGHEEYHQSKEESAD